MTPSHVNADNIKCLFETAPQSGPIIHGQENGMREYTKFYIDGAWVDPAAPKPLDVINPAVNRVMASVGATDPAPAAVNISTATKAEGATK